MKVLVAQQYGLGNAIMTTPLLKALNTLPKMVVHCSFDEKRKAAGVVLGDIPSVKKVHGCRATQEIIKEQFDVVIPCGRLPHLKSRYQIPRMLMTMPHVPAGTSQQRYPKHFKKHEVEYLMDAARLLGFVGDTPWPFIGRVDEVTLDTQSRKVALGIGYFKGDGWSRGKHWGNIQYKMLADDLALMGIEVFLVGGPSDKEDVKEILSLAESRPRNMCERLSVRAVFGLINGCDAFVGNDTGFAHASAALGIPTMTVFNTTISSPKKNAPLGPKAKHICETRSGAKYREVLDWVQRVVLKEQA